MIELKELESAAERLRVYDVDQAAWENEGQGYEINAKHVLLHLAKDMATKSFSDAETVETAIAPDSMQYAIRLVRWTGQDTRMTLPGKEQAGIVRSTSTRFNGRLPNHRIAVIEAISSLAGYLHDCDHESQRQRVEQDKLFVARRAARLLIYSADLQANKYKFSLIDAFDARISSLRERFGIPQPQASE
jgi:hypothetical protein